MDAVGMGEAMLSMLVSVSRTRSRLTPSSHSRLSLSLPLRSLLHITTLTLHLILPLRLAYFALQF